MDKTAKKQNEPKTAAERQRKRREKLKKEGKYEAYKKNQNQQQKKRRKVKKLFMTKAEKYAVKEKNRQRKRKSRAKKRARTEEEKECESAGMTRASLARSTKKAEKGLPLNPKKKKLVVKNLCQKITPELVKSESKTYHNTDDETVKTVQAFFMKDAISMQAPGMNDFRVIRKDGKKEKIQKRYLCMTLSEVFEQFQLEYPTAKIGLSKFCELRPEFVCLRSDTPEHVCLCIYHENVRLILNGVSFLPNSTSELCQLLVCNPDRSECMLQTCEDCKNLNRFEKLVDSLDDETLQSVTAFKQWGKTEGERLLRSTITDTVENVLATLKSKLGPFLEHVYIKHEQEKYFEHIKCTIPEGTLIIHSDFSENYVHKIQNEVQSRYWDAQSSTIYTTMVYYQDRAGQVQVASQPYVVISEYKSHDKYAVQVFSQAIVSDFKRQNPEVKVNALHFQSDGAAQHFKQKYSLCSMTLNAMPTIWSFSATSHGKGCIDGIGGTLKRRVTEYTLATNTEINSSKSFAQVATNVCKNINIIYISSDEVKAKITTFDKKWMPEGKKIQTVPDTRGSHYFESIRPYVLKYSMTAAQKDTEYSLFSFKDGIIRL